jgi:hypothetical protein
METAKGRNQMTDIQLLKVTELLNQYGDQVVKRERFKDSRGEHLWFRIDLSGDRWIRIMPGGDKHWHLKSKLHRNGPAVEWTDGSKHWFPAIELTDLPTGDGSKKYLVSERSERQTASNQRTCF